MSPPTEVQTLAVNGTRLSFVAAGQGPRTVVFVHGSLDDYRSWRYQLEPFSQHYRVVALSRRYHFPNAWDSANLEYSTELHAADLAAFIEAVTDEPVHLVTSSWGGNVGLSLAGQRPDLVHSLVLGEPPLLPWLIYIPGGKVHWQRFLDEAWYPAQQAFREDRPEDGVRLFLDAVMGRPTFQHLGQRGRQMMMDNAAEMRSETLAGEAYFPAFTCAEAEALGQPVLLCKGELSPPVFRMITDDLAQCLSHARGPVVIPGASHAMHVGNPSFYNRTVLEFLASC